MFDSPAVQTFSLEQCDDMGVSATGNSITDKGYLIHDESTTIEIREVPQERGGVRYSVDQQMNPQTVGLKAGGTFGEKMVIAGQLGPGTGDATSDELAKMLLKELRKQFTKIKSYYVGNEAESLLDSGARLTINSAASIKYDLVR
ncbi:hypothetical protein [Gimesia panareensis]|nr:hypothetical protein [Gimesia panareensis]